MPVRATEGGVGRPITGMQPTPEAGVVPPASDWIVTLAIIYYEGSLGSSRTLPVAGTITAGLTYTAVYSQANLIKTRGITLGGWNFATSVGLGPVITWAGKVARTPVSADCAGSTNSRRITARKETPCCIRSARRSSARAVSTPRHADRFARVRRATHTGTRFVRTGPLFNISARESAHANPDSIL
ncbi:MULTISPECIES: hypothetical protein [unclassified Caballeronia]|uniref:hypothetical protein n=1 Tax=unclassified Caballeronia TaxID=2646786 RepID=UPI0028544795|nr:MULTISPECIES: hypothetical protein [unclassified Caballeronia]MDR5753912.1 hypothetical protein [Caballeronia sp. LZ024]MDR5840291.1 hypothetical protein [Caballeronia sp. LZ031]